MTPAARARESAGLSLEQAARQARVSHDYLRQVERTNSAPYSLARRLANIYGSSIQTFLPSTETVSRKSGAPCGSGASGNNKKRRSGCKPSSTP
jgi:transcriptional regulator with XRE-family HTH domain